MKQIHFFTLPMSFVLMLNAFNALACQPGNCSSRWDSSIDLRVKNHPNLAGFFNDYGIKKMYAQRDYFRASVAAKLTTDIYDHWHDIIVNERTAGLYIDFLRVYNSKINHLMYPSDLSYEGVIFIDDELYQHISAIVNLHRASSSSPEFIIFLSEVTTFIELFRGKSIRETRIMLFPDSSTCSQQQRIAGYCD